MYDVSKFPDDHWMLKVQKALARMWNITFVFFKGRGLFTNRFGLLPFRTPINTVVGRAIEVEQCDKPTQEQIDHLHQTYLDTLTKLYDEYNPIYGNEDVQLNIM